MNVLKHRIREHFANEARFGYSLIVVNVVFLLALAIVMSLSDQGRHRLLAVVFGDWSSYLI